MIERNEVIQYLNKNISLVYNDEERFIEKFQSYLNIDAFEIIRFYMASERVYIQYFAGDYETITTTIPTNEFLDWCEDIEKGENNE